MEDRRCRFHATFLGSLRHPSYRSYISILSLYLSCISSSLMGDRLVWVNARKSLQVGMKQDAPRADIRQCLAGICQRCQERALLASVCLVLWRVALRKCGTQGFLKRTFFDQTVGHIPRNILAHVAETNFRMNFFFVVCFFGPTKGPKIKCQSYSSFNSIHLSSLISYH